MSSFAESKFIDFIIRNNIIEFKDTVLKSGEITDHYYNFSGINNSKLIYELGKYINHFIIDEYENYNIKFNTIFTSPYKGIILSTAFLCNYEISNKNGNINFGYFRKERKRHGDKQEIVGYIPGFIDEVIIFDDVLTTGSSIKEVYRRLKNYGCKINSALVLINRASDEYIRMLSSQLKIGIHYLTTDEDIMKIYNETITIRDMKNYYHFYG